MTKLCIVTTAFLIVVSPIVLRSEVLGTWTPTLSLGGGPTLPYITLKAFGGGYVVPPSDVYYRAGIDWSEFPLFVQNVGTVFTVTPADPQFAAFLEAFTNGVPELVGVSVWMTLSSGGQTGTHQSASERLAFSLNAADFQGYAISQFSVRLDSLSIVPDTPSPCVRSVRCTVTWVVEGSPVVGDVPLITSPAENEWFACNAPVNYCWELPGGVMPDDVSGYELQFSTTQTPDGPWDALRFLTTTCWVDEMGHECAWEALYWRVRIVYQNGDRSPWAVSHHQVGAPEVGPPPVIAFPAEDAWFALNTPVPYCWQLPSGIAPAEVSGYELQFSTTQTPDGPWDALRFQTTTCWVCEAGYQSAWEALYWRVRIVYQDGDRSPWALSHHRVGTDVQIEQSSWGRIKSLYE